MTETAKLVTIERPGIYDMPDDDYHADPCPSPSLSSSVAKILIDQTPLHAWMAHPRLNPHHEPENRPEFDVGRATHDLLLRGQDCMAILDVDDFRTKAAREARDTAYAEGKTPLKRSQWDAVQRMAHSVRKQLDCHREAFQAFTNGKPEQAMIWREGKIWCRAKLDWLPQDGAIFYDFKTTTDANPEAWQRRLFETGADMQCAFYRRGIRELLGIEQPVFRFVVVEDEMPHAMSVVELDPAGLDLAEQKAADAIDLWSRCLAADKWPGYAPRVYYVSPPPWQLTKWEERKMQREISDHFIEYFGL